MRQNEDRAKTEGTPCPSIPKFRVFLSGQKPPIQTPLRD